MNSITVDIQENTAVVRQYKNRRGGGNEAGVC